MSIVRLASMPRTLRGGGRDFDEGWGTGEGVVSIEFGVCGPMDELSEEDDDDESGLSGCR